MRWMFIAAGLLAAASAIGLIAAWGRWYGKKQKGEVSLAATVKRVTLNGECGPMVSFVCQSGEVRFAVPREIARQLEPGERGVLTHQGNQFIYFVSREDLLGPAMNTSLAKVS